MSIGANSIDYQFGFTAGYAAAKAEVKHGRWIKDEYGIPHCSECKAINNTVYRNFCPNCQCCVSYERRLKETNGHEYCKQATYIETSKQGYTHCQREKRKRNVNRNTDTDDI